MKETIFLIVIKILCLLTQAQILSSTYFYTQMITLFQGNNFTTNSRPSGYTFPVTWKNTQLPFINSSFYLMGWRIDNTAKWLSFDARINSVTLTGATFYFNPSTYSQIVYAQFGLILLKNKPGIVKMIYVVHNSILGNGVTSQTLSLSVGATFGADTTVYKAKAIISSFTMPYAGPHYWSQTLQLTCKPIVSNTSQQSITMTTHYQTITLVSFTYIMMDLSTMIPLPLIYFQVFISYWAGPMITVPAQFNFRQNYNCIFGVVGVSTSWLNGYHELSLAPSTSTDISIAYDLKVYSIWQFYYSLICTGGQCTNGTVVDPATSLYLCKPCSSFMTNCYTCSAKNICTICNPLFTISQPLNASCVACPTNCLNCTKIGSNMTCQICITSYYFNGVICSPCLSECLTCNTSTTCLTCIFGWPITGGCTNITYCQQVFPNSPLISKCSKCASPWILGVGVCLSTYGCTYASYVWVTSGYLSTCTNCNTTAYYDPLAVNGTCVCSPGYTIHRTTHASCIKCPLNCLSCVQSNNVGVCQQCRSNYTLYKPLNLSCIILPPHCISSTIHSGNVSCDACQDGYFINISNPLFPLIKICQPCLIDCLTCISDSTCTTCKYGGVPVLGGCTLIPFCKQVKRNDLKISKCIECEHVHRYQLFLGLCVNITGCIVPHLLGNIITCLNCNSALKFQSVPINNSCLCSDGYSLDPFSLVCIQICGDGKVYNLQCDDGNMEDGDGCSSKCTVQNRFACIDGNITSPSRCIYLFFDIKMKVKKISKVFMENKGIFTFQISPRLTIYKRIEFSKIQGLATQRLLKVLSVSFINNEIKVELDFSEDLQTFPASFKVDLPKRYFLQKNVQIQFDMVSDDVKLIIISDKQKMLLYIKLQKIISIIALCVFAAGSLSHKMIGLETLVPIQIIYLSHLLNSDVTPIYSMLGFFANSAFNLLHSQNHLSNIAAGNPSTYSEENEGVTMSVMLLLALSAAVVFCVIVVLRLLTNREDERAKSTKEEQKRLRIVAMLSEMGYSHFVFPFLMGTFCVYWPLSVAYEHGKTALGSASLRMGGLQAIALALAFFYEWKEALLQEAGERQSFFRLKRCSRQYAPLFLTYLFAVTVFLCLGFIQIIEAKLFLAATLSVALISFAVFRPYEDAIHNLGVIYNSAIAAAFSGWNLARRFFPKLALEENEENAIMAVIGSVTVCLLLATVRIIFHLHGVLSEGLCSELKQAPQKANTAEPQKITVEEIYEGSSRQKLLPFHKQYLLNCGLQEKSDNIHLQTPVNYFQKNWQKPAKFNSKLQNSKQQLRNRLLRTQASK